MILDEHGRPIAVTTADKVADVLRDVYGSAALKEFQEQDGVLRRFIGSGLVDPSGRNIEAAPVAVSCRGTRIPLKITPPE